MPKHPTTRPPVKQRPKAEISYPEATFFILLAIGFFTLSLFSYYSRSSETTHLEKTAITQLQNGNYDAAYQALTRAILLDPHNPSLHFDLAKLFQSTNNWPDASKEFQIALELSPNWEAAKKELSETTTIIREPRKIRDETSFWENQVKLKPDYRDGWIQLAIRHYQLYEMEKAKTAINKAFEIDPNFETTKKLLEIIK